MLDEYNFYVTNGECELESYLETVADGNDVFKEYVTTTDQQNQSVQGLMRATQAARAKQLEHNEAIKNSTLTARAGKIAFQAFSAATNALFMLGISTAINLVVKGLDNLLHSTEHCRERVDQLMSSYKSALDTANSNANTVERLAERYEELSKGVNGLGEIYSLTAEEANEYHDICNQIAGMFPNLVKGYTEEGNAILSLRGNVELLRATYKEAQQEAYNLLLPGDKDSNGDDIIKNWKNLHHTGIFSMLFDLGADDVGGNLSTREALDQLQAVSELTAERYKNIITAAWYGPSEYTQQLSDAEKIIGNSHYLKKVLGVTVDSTDEEFANAIQKAKTLAQTYQAKIDSALYGVRTLANSYLVTNEDYAELDESAKNAASIIVNSISENIANGFDSSEAVGGYVVKIVETIKDNPGISDALIGLFELDTTNMPVQEAQRLIDLFIKSITNGIQEDELELKIMFGFNGIDETAQKLRESIRTISDLHGIADREEYSRLAEYTESFTQSETERWLMATRGAKNAAQAVQMYEDFLSRASRFHPNWQGLTENQSKSIDDFQSKISELTSALSSLQSEELDSAAFTDLLQKFPQLYDKTDNLDTAIQDLISTLLEDLYTALGDDIPTSLKESLQSIADEARRTALDIKSLSEAFSDLQMIHDLRQSLQEEISGGSISSSTLQSIIDKYPLLEDAVNAYCGGLLTESELYELLCQQYAQDMNVFQETSRAKIYTNEIFYNQCLNANGELINRLAETYELDFQNFKNVEAAKLAGEQKLLGNMAGLWSKYYEIILDKDGLYKIRGTAYSETYDVQNSSEYIEMEEKTQELQRFLDKLNQAFRLDTVTSIEFSPGSLGENSSADTEEFSEELNWVEKFIARTSSALNKLKDKVSDTYISWSLRNHSLSQAMQKTKEAIGSQQQAYEKYMQRAAAVGLSQEYISRIQNGTLELETVTDKDLADRISEYETWYDKAMECSDAIGDLKNQLAELARQKFDNINTYFRGLMDTAEKTIDRLNTRENNSFKTTDVSLYKSQYAETRALMDYNTQRAKQLEEALDSAVSGGYIEAGSQAWREMYNEILEVRNATEEYGNELNEIAQKEYDALLKPFENALTRLEHRKSVIETMAGRLELQGYTAGKGLYERQLRDDEASLRSLAEQAAQLRRNMQDAMEKGLETGSDQWLEMQSAIDENVFSTMELENSILKLKNTIRELDWEKFDRLQDSLSHITDESDFLLDLFDQDDLYGEDGRLNENGNAVIGLHARNYYTQSELAERYRAELDKISAQLAADPYNTTLEQRKYDLADAYRAAAKAAYEEYHAVTELGQKGYQSQTDAVLELIEAKKRQMDTDKSLYEHQKNIAEKTKNIASIQKQLSALAGDESEENKAKIQKLKVDLEEAQRDLEEATYDKWYSDQSDMLDKLAEEYEALITGQSQDEQAIFQEMISSANANAQGIRDTITDTAQKWGYRPSGDLESAWTPGPDGVTDIGGNISQQVQRLYELNEMLYRAGAALGDLGVTDYGLETTITDETTAKNYIERLYRGLLHRDPDEAGMDFWLERLMGGATVQDMLEGFLNSQEYLAMNKSVSDTILDFYQGLLGRPAEAAGYQYWMEQYHGGMSLSEIGAHGFLNSREFLSDKMWLDLADAGLLMQSLQFLPPVSAPEARTPDNPGGAPSFGDIHITIPIEHVNDYNDFVTQLQKDGKFERMIQDMTLGQVLGRGSLSKNSYRF